MGDPPCFVPEFPLQAAPMPPPSFQARLLAARDLTHNVREFTVAPVSGAPMSFRAGQYLNLVLDPGGPERERIVRAYSLCSAPSEAVGLRFVANLVPGGAGSTRLFGLAVGTEFEIRGPLGSFTLNEKQPHDFLFVATGTGIGPLRAMIHQLFHLDTQRQVTLVWGLRSQRDLYFQEDFAALARRHPNFSYVTTLSQPAPGWAGAVGRVTTLLPERIRRVDHLEVYLCGNGEMITAVRAYIKTLGLCPVRTEKFF